MPESTCLSTATSEGGWGCTCRQKNTSSATDVMVDGVGEAAGQRAYTGGRVAAAAAGNPAGEATAGGGEEGSRTSGSR